MKLVFILLAIIFLKVILIDKVVSCLPYYELRRRARAKDASAAKIYKLAGFGKGLDLTLWLVGAASASTLILWSAATTWPLAVLVMVAIAWLLFWSPSPQPNGWAWKLTVLTTPYTVRGLDFISPVLKFLVGLIPTKDHQWPRTNLYEKEDLLDLLNTQNHQPDNRIPEPDLRMAFNALTFNSRKVSEVMTPKAKTKFVPADEPIGPMLMDELHATGQVRFAVIKDASKVKQPKVIGSLYAKDLVDHQEKGKVSSLMHTGVHYVNEAASLQACMAAFLKTQDLLLVVVNNFEELVGIITLENVLEQIVGQPIVDEFDRYDNLRAVAGYEAAPQPEAKTPEQSKDSVVN